MKKNRDIYFPAWSRDRLSSFIIVYPASGGSDGPVAGGEQPGDEG